MTPRIKEHGKYVYECDTCGSSIELNVALLDSPPNVGQADGLVRCGDHRPSMPMRRVD